MSKLILLCFIVTLTVFGCKTKDGIGVTISLKDNDVFIDRMPLDEVEKHWKAKRIEKRILAKLKQIQAKAEKSTDTEVLNPESYPEFYCLLSNTCLILGKDSLKYLKSLKIKNEHYIFVVKELVPIIEARLKLIDLLKGYSPKNELEAKILNRIKEYSAMGQSSYWWNEGLHKNDAPMTSSLIGKLKIGPLLNDKYIYVRYYGTESYEGDKILGFQAATAVKSKIILAYELDYNLPSTKKLK
jgi:hypothetical protein